MNIALLLGEDVQILSGHDVFILFKGVIVLYGEGNSKRTHCWICGQSVNKGPRPTLAGGAEFHRTASDQTHK